MTYFIPSAGSLVIEMPAQRIMKKQNPTALVFSRLDARAQGQ